MRRAKPVLDRRSAHELEDTRQMTTKFWGDYRTSGVFKFAFFLPIQTPPFDGDLPF